MMLEKGVGIVSWIKDILDFPDHYEKWKAFIKNHPKPATVFASILLLAVVVIIVFFICKSCNNSLEIKITSPLNNDKIYMDTIVRGYTTAEIPEKAHLYIVVEYDKKWWPQVKELQVKKSEVTGFYDFDSQIRVGIQPEDVGRVFVIKALVGDSVIYKQFESWFQQNSGTGDWPGIPVNNINQDKDIICCDNITILRK
jgi:hypothetical protein